MINELPDVTVYPNLQCYHIVLVCLYMLILRFMGDKHKLKQNIRLTNIEGALNKEKTPIPYSNS